MKPSTRLALLLSIVLGAVFALAFPARADQLPATGTSAEQFALMGGVFLILGGTFVFAPQIINAINGFLAALFRRPRKTQASPPAEASPPQASAASPFEPAVGHADPDADHEAWAPPGSEDRGAVSRLRDEISSSWGGTEPR